MHGFGHGPEVMSESRSRHEGRFPTGPERSAIVANGRGRLVSGFEAEVRGVVEADYAEQWNRSGLWRRWKLQRLIDAEVAERVSRSLERVSKEACY